MDCVRRVPCSPAPAGGRQGSPETPSGLRAGAGFLRVLSSPCPRLPSPRQAWGSTPWEVPTSSQDVTVARKEFTLKEPAVGLQTPRSPPACTGQHRLLHAAGKPSCAPSPRPPMLACQPSLPDCSPGSARESADGLSSSSQCSYRVPPPTVPAGAAGHSQLADSFTFSPRSH